VKPRTAQVSRKTRETEIHVEVSLDSSGVAEVDTGIPFLNHMLEALATHSLIDITVRARGDLAHHVIEDTSISLGEALRKALGDAVGIRRFGYASVPMDDSLSFASIDLVERPFAKIDLKIEGQEVEETHTENIQHFLESLAMSMRANIHIWVQYGEDDHHKLEAAFKALALSLRRAVSKDPRREGVPSSKGVI